MSKRMSTSKKRWTAIDALLQHFESEELRKFFGAAIKFLIRPADWKDRHPTSPFESDPVVRSFHLGFDTFFEKEMRGLGSLPMEDQVFLELIRRAANPSRRWSRRVAKRKSTRLRKMMWKRFTQYIPEATDRVRGLRHYEELVRTKYLNE